MPKFGKKKIVSLVIVAVLVFAMAYAINYLANAFPIIAGYGAKNLCSCVFVAGRDPQQVIAQELGADLVKLGTYAVDMTDSSATGTVFGFSKRKAIYRKGLGCTLVSERSEAELRNEIKNLAGPPVVRQDTLVWPDGDLIDATLWSQYGKLQAVVRNAFNEQDSLKPVNTRAVVVVHHGNLVAEQYAPSFTADTRLMGWSMTKTLTNAMVGVLAKQGKLQVSLPAPVPEWRNDERSNITLNDLMQASSGLQWEEVYAGASMATNCLFRKADAGGYAASAPLVHAPGSIWYYSSGTTNIISRIVRHTVGDDKYYRFPYEEIFHRIGAYSLVIEPDASGTFVGSSFSYATARDWARVGMLFLNDGIWNGERILPEGWVQYSVTPAKAAPLGEYGAQVWLNAGSADNPG